MSEGASHAGRVALPWLVADVGGTNARFGWVQEPGRGVEHVRTLPVAEHDSLGGAATAYLGALAPLLGLAPAVPKRAAMAVATAVGGDWVDFTNSRWAFSRRQLQQQLGLDTLLVLNDFEALALSLPRLGPSQLRAHADLPRPRGTLAVIGPGTGLGVGGVKQTPHGWLALAGEGGHATIAPADDFESEVLREVRREYEHVSAERLLSGIGLPVLHQAVARVSGGPAPLLTAEAIVEQADDAQCARTLDTFCSLLGGFAGNVALTLGARDGVYIGGGIVPRLGDRFFTSSFRNRFESKGRFRSYLEPIPTAVIVDTLAALVGATLALEQHDA
jgi:glucokinase